MRFIDCETRLPKKFGKYLVIRKVFGKATIDILGFSPDLYALDKYDFQRYKGKKKAGFYLYDSEYGYSDIDMDKVLAWANLPKIPDQYVEE